MGKADSFNVAHAGMAVDSGSGAGGDDCEALQLNSPHGGSFRNLLVDPAMTSCLKAQARDWPFWQLTDRQICDLELLLNGGFNPLAGFMRKTDYDRVCREMRLQDGTLWPIPVVLDVSETFAQQVGIGSKVVLRDQEGSMLAVLTVDEMWRPDRLLEAESVYGTTSREHPGVRYLLSRVEPVYIGGRVEGLLLPEHHDFRDLRHTPEQLRNLFLRMGWQKVIVFQTRNPMHQGHFEMTLRATREHRANLLIHPVVGTTRPGDVDHFCRVRCYQAVLPRYPENLTRLSLLPLSMRMAGPREAVWHAIIRRNYGCSHLIVGRDHAGPGSGNGGVSFYSPYAAQDLVQQYETELGVHVVPFRRMVYVPSSGKCQPEDEIAPGKQTLDMSGTELRKRLAEGREIPEWFTFPEVAAELRRAFPARARQGFTIFFTGLSGSGKSTLGKVLAGALLELGPRPVTLLDGDIVRKHLSSELGFSREHRDLNIRRIGFVANEIAKNGGIAICAPIAPYDAIRKEVRELISSRGGFVLVYLSTPLEVCERRDHKGLYAKARAGLIPEFTGVSDPYEPPADAEVVLNTAEVSVEAGCQAILKHLHQAGYLPNWKAVGAFVVGDSLVPDVREGSCMSRKVETSDGPLPSASEPQICMSAAQRVSQKLWPADSEKLCAAAQRQTGLTDFGDPPLEPALPSLLNSLDREAELRPMGRFLMWTHLQDLLKTRLRLAEAWKQKSDALREQPIERPVFIIGMPRSGSTFLHELLAEDPRHRAPRAWEVMFPVGASERQRIRKAEVCLWLFRRLAREADTVYPMRARTPHECVAIQSYTFMSEEFVSTCRIPGYEAFLHSADLNPVYAWEKQFLQYLNMSNPGKRWVLKSPDHVCGLAALFSIFPDALVVQTHRNPLEVLESSAQLTRVLHGLYGEPRSLEEIWMRERKILAERTERFLHFRDLHPELASRFIDVTYFELIANPMITVRRIYDRLESSLSTEAAERIERLVSNRSRYKRHRTFRAASRTGPGSSLEAVVFERYCSRFGLSLRRTEPGQ